MPKLNTLTERQAMILKEALELYKEEIGLYDTTTSGKWDPEEIEDINYLLMQLKH